MKRIDAENCVIMSENKSIDDGALEERELRLANEHLRYRGSSLKELLNTIIDSDPDEELSVRFKKMDFYDSVRLSEIESELFPERSSVYKTIEEAIEDSKNW